VAKAPRTSIKYAGRILIDRRTGCKERTGIGQTAAHNNNTPNRPPGQFCFTFSLPLPKHPVGVAIAAHFGPRAPPRTSHRVTGPNMGRQGPFRGPQRLTHSTSERKNAVCVINAAQLTGAPIWGARFDVRGPDWAPQPSPFYVGTLTFLFLASADPHWTEKSHISGRSVHIILRGQPSCQSPLVARHLCACATCVDSSLLASWSARGAKPAKFAPHPFCYLCD
jgi:hypothetical protein